MSSKRGGRKAVVDDDDDMLAKVKKRQKAKPEQSSDFPAELWIVPVEGASPPEYKVITGLTEVPEGTKIAAYEYSSHGKTEHTVNIVDDVGEDDA